MHTLVSVSFKFYSLPTPVPPLSSSQHALDEEDCMRAFVRRLLSTPQGGAAFFRLKSVEDSDSIFPPSMILGINERGVSGKE